MAEPGAVGWSGSTVARRSARGVGLADVGCTGATPGRGRRWRTARGYVTADGDAPAEPDGDGLAGG